MTAATLCSGLPAVKAVVLKLATAGPTTGAGAGVGAGAASGSLLLSWESSLRPLALREALVRRELPPEAFLACRQEGGKGASS